MKIIRTTTIHLYGALKNVFLNLLGAILVVVAATVVVWPLWYLATVHTVFYTLLMAVVVACGLVFVGLRRIRRCKADSSTASIGR